MLICDLLQHADDAWCLVGWKIIKEGEETDDDSTSDEDW